MINENTSSRNKNRPFLLKPAGQDYLWGGTKLKKEYFKELDKSPLAETWECSTHPAGTSIINSGEFAGQELTEVLHLHPEYLGTHPKTKGELPILVKFIDAKEKLSIQVHPDDEYAKKYEKGSLGKTEMWYVMEAEENAKLIYGFQRDMDVEEVKKGLQSGTIEKYLQKIPVRKDDVFYIEAGTVHAIGEGIVLAEIQENSNLTYRLYDYNRIDKNGKKRKLHVEKALQVINLKGSADVRQPLRVLKYQKGCASELLCRCEYFQVERMLVNTRGCNTTIKLQTSYNSFQILLCMDGEGSLKEENGTCLNIRKGDCIFIPADSVKLELEGRGQLLRIGC